MGVATVSVLEVGGTHVTAASVELSTWEVRVRARHRLDSGAPAPQIIGALTSAARTLGGAGPTPWAMAVPDPFDYARGIALFRDVGKFEALYGVDLRRALTDAIDPRPSRLAFVHDAEAFLVGEWSMGAALGAERCVGVTLGSGIGSAFLDHGRPVRSGAGLPPDGRIHRQLLDGSPLETVVSRRAIRARYAAATGDRAADVHEIANRARGGEVAAVIALTEAFHALGRALAPCLESFAPDVLVVGGSMSASWDLIAAPLAAGLAEHGVTGVAARPAQHPVDAPLIGAASLTLASPAPAVP